MGEHSGSTRAPSRYCKKPRLSGLSGPYPPKKGGGNGLSELLCACGHTAHWHAGPDSDGACEHDGTCACLLFAKWERCEQCGLTPQEAKHRKSCADHESFAAVVPRWNPALGEDRIGLH